MARICFLLLMFLLPACEKRNGADDQAVREDVSLTVPATLKIVQRTALEIPGSDGRLFLSIEDITNWQVVAGIVSAEQNLAVAARSMKEGDEMAFSYEGDHYVLLLKRLNNMLVGNDSAEFVLLADDGSSAAKSKVQGEVNQLLDALKTEQGAVMIRNGKEYPSDKGAEHLMTKYRHVEERIGSAEDFIDQVASKSSTSGEDYRIRLKDGSSVTTREWFTDRLNKLRKASE